MCIFYNDPIKTILHKMKLFLHLFSYFFKLPYFFARKIKLLSVTIDVLLN